MKSMLRYKQSLITSACMFSSLFTMELHAQVSQNDSKEQRGDLQALPVLLKQSGGTLSPQLRAAFLAQGRAHVLQELKKRGVVIDSEVMEWVDGDEIVSDAVYATIHPADPDILINLNTLWQAQGGEFTKKYKHLALGAAVARRGIGVGPLANFSKWGRLYKSAERAREDGQIPAEALSLSKGKSEHLLPQTQSDKAAYQAVAAYLKKQSITHRQAFEDKDKLEEITAILQKNNSKIKANHCLKGLLILHGERPEERTARATVAEYHKFLVKINETPASDLSLEEGQRWPLFPVTTAPWPIVMPLSRTMPMDEARYIWEKFQGQHDGKRVHNYGPYRKGEKAQIPTYEDRPWHWQAWPSVIKEGGVCGTMSTIAMGTYTALGRPVLKAAQPRHSCLVTYNVTSDGKMMASLGQSVTAGPDGTGTSWLFKDGASWRCSRWGSNAVHHYGLALAMNPGLKSYMDTRIALHIYRGLPESKKSTTGKALLHDVLKRNPYNTEVWYTLANDTKEVRELLSLMASTKTLLSSSAEAEIAQNGDASEAIAGAEAEGNKISKSVDKTLATYQKLVKEAIVMYAFEDPAKFDRKNQELALNYLEKNAGASREVVLAKDRFSTALNGSSSLTDSLQKDLQTFLKSPPNGKKNKGRAEGELKRRLHQVSDLCDDRAEREQWLRAMMASFPPAKATLDKKKSGEKKFSPLYGELYALLNKSYLSKPRNKNGQKDLAAMKEKMLQG